MAGNAVPNATKSGNDPLRKLAGSSTLSKAETEAINSLVKAAVAKAIAPLQAEHREMEAQLDRLSNPPAINRRPI